MKSLKKIMIAAILLLSIPSAFAQLSRVDIVATGLTCSMCSNAINKQLKTLTDVEKVDIDLNTNTFVVFLKKNNQIGVACSGGSGDEFCNNFKTISKWDITIIIIIIPRIQRLLYF